eukprot:SAG11_NODE_35693_length_265_cov_0.933735_1_plen_53_part_01
MYMYMHIRRGATVGLLRVRGMCVSDRILRPYPHHGALTVAPSPRRPHHGALTM